MRVLFTTWAWPSHLYPMVPLAWALRTAGNDVTFAGPPALRATAAGAGLPFAAVGSDVDAVAMFRELIAPGARPAANGRPRVLGVFRRIAAATAVDLIDFARDWRPDLMIVEPTAWAGFVCASALGVPAVRLLYGLDLLMPLAEHVREELAPLAAGLGAGDVDPYTVPAIDPCPPGLRLPGPTTRHPLRYVPYNGPGTVPRLPRASRPRVALTWGYTMAKLGGAYFFAREALAALAEMDDIDVVAVTDAAHRNLLGPRPGNALLVESAPLDAVLPSCDAVVAHGGAGSLMTALCHGLPQVLVPQLPDHTAHARRLAETGAGVMCPRAEATPERVRELVRNVLHKPHHRSAAVRLGNEIADQPSPIEVARELGKRLRKVNAARL